MKIHRFLLLPLAVAAAPALAADLPSAKAPPLYSATPATLWSGFYIGAQGGLLGLSDSPRQIDKASDATLATAQRFGNGGLTGGVHLGYDRQFGSWVVGGVGDVNFGRVSANGLDPLGVRFTDTVGTQLSTRVRGGYAFDRLLLYGTVGVNFASVQHRYEAAGLSAKKDRWIASPTVGVGAAYAFTENWRGFVEYRVAPLSLDESTPVLPGVKVRHRFGEDTLQVGAAYRF